MGSRLCVFTTSSFAFGYFRLLNINLSFLFALMTVHRKITHHRIATYFGSYFAAAVWITNPSGTFLFKRNSFAAYWLSVNCLAHKWDVYFCFLNSERGYTSTMVCLLSPHFLLTIGYSLHQTGNSCFMLRNWYKGNNMLFYRR